MWELISRKYPVFQFLGTSINLQKLLRINVVFLKYGLQQLMGRFISNTKFWKIFVINNVTSYCFYLQV